MSAKESPIMIANSPVLLQGWLHKKSRGVITRWTRRYFVLTAVKLYYYSDSDISVSPKGEVEMKDCSITTAEHVSQRKYAFGLFHTSRRAYLLAADDEDEMVQWIDTIETRCLGIEEHVSLHDFELLTLVGRGSHGSVLQVKKKDSGKIYALKVLKLDASNAHVHNQVHAVGTTERRVLEVVNHPYIVKMHYAFRTETKLFLVLDFYNGGELFSVIDRQQKLSEDAARLYAAEIALALNYLHELDMVYRDLKPENVLLDMEGHVRLSDFGLAKDEVEGRTNSIVGSPYYMAPEIVLRRGHDQCVDWWSLGVLLFEMITGVPPFYDKDIKKGMQALINGEIAPQIPEYVSPDCKDLLCKLICSDPTKRLGGGANGFQALQNHSFFKEIDWKKLLAREIPSSWKPNVTSIQDVSNFHLHFTRDVEVISGLEVEQQHKISEETVNAGLGADTEGSFGYTASVAAAVGGGGGKRIRSKRTGHGTEISTDEAATEFLSSCNWQINRAVKCLMSAVLNREAAIDAVSGGTDGLSTHHELVARFRQAVDNYAEQVHASTSMRLLPSLQMREYGSKCCLRSQSFQLGG